MPSSCPGSLASAAPSERLADPRPKASSRLRGACVLAPCLVIVALAWWLMPRAAGHGTHRQLGLPGCSFLVRTGLPCPSCGLTTSMAFMARGRVVQAYRAHPFGVVLFVAVVAAAGVGAGELATGRNVWGRLQPSVWWCVLGIAALLAGWGWMLLTGLLSGRLPMR